MGLSRDTHQQLERSPVMKNHWQNLGELMFANIEINHPQTAHLICQLIPAQCPFEHDIYLFNQLVLRIPPLCKLNPFYEQFVALRFQALTFLAEDCGEDVTRFCH